MLQLPCKTLIKPSCLTSSLVCHWHQFALSSHLESSTIRDFRSWSSYLSKTDMLAIGTAKACPCPYVQIAVTALLMFTENNIVYFKPTGVSFKPHWYRSVDLNWHWLFVFFFIVLCYHCLLWQRCCLKGILPALFQVELFCCCQVILLRRLCSQVSQNGRLLCRDQAVRLFFDAALKGH